MGRHDMERQKIQVFRMRSLGCEVVPCDQGSKTLVEAVSSNDDINLTISNLDAVRIRDAEKKFGLLTNCKVLVLLK